MFFLNRINRAKTKKKQQQQQKTISSFALGSAHEKFDAWRMPFSALK